MAGDAGGAAIGDIDLAETDPGEQSLHEAIAFRQLAKGIDHPPVEQAEIADVARDRHLAEAVDQPVEGARRGALQPAFTGPATAAHVDHFGAADPGVEHLRDQFRGVLQVGIDDDHRGAARQLEPGAHRLFLAEVAGEAGHAHPAVGGL